jgi:hypothetical protein
MMTLNWLHGLITGLEVENPSVFDKVPRGTGSASHFDLAAIPLHQAVLP